MTKSQIDKLGERLRRGEQSAEVDSMLEALYDAYEPVGVTVGDVVAKGVQDFSPESNEWVGPDSQPATFSRRPTKSEASIVAKLRREKTRLSTMQDIVGGRIVVR
jgi:ppGpp synthetase/RelA/SpoT-type nucleotidyltranferase